MGKGISKEAIERRKALDEEVRPYWEMGLPAKDIAYLLDTTTMAVAYSIRRLRDGYSQFMKAPTQDVVEREAQMLIDAKLAPTVTPKVHKVMVNGWENGHYVHYEAYDVSEFWGL